jgi:hypothetical protein
MGQIYDQAKVVYSDGPSSDPDDPPKSEIRALFKTVDETIVTALAGIRTFSAWADLAAVSTGLVAGQTAYVKGDAGTHTDPVAGGTVSNSGEFSWSTAPAGWERIGDVPESAADVASDLADLDAAVVKLTGAQTVDGIKTFSEVPVIPGYASLGADGRVPEGQTASTVLSQISALNDFSIAQTIGRPVGSTLAVGSGGLPAFTIALANPAAKSGYLSRLRVYAATAGTIYFRRFTKAGDVFTRVGHDYPVRVSSGSQTLTREAGDFDIIPIEAGEYFGWYQNGIITSVVATADGDGYYISGSGDFSSFTDIAANTTPQIQIGLDFATGETPSAVKGLNDRADEVVGYPATYGVTNPPVTGSAVLAHTFVYGNPVADGGRIIGLRAFLLSSATLYIKIFEKDGDSFSIVSRHSVPLASGLNDLDLDDIGQDILVKAGHHIGFYVGTALTFNGSSGGQSGGYYSSLGDVDSFSDATTENVVRLNIAFDVETGRLPDVQARVNALEIASEAVALYYDDNIVSAEASTSGLSVSCDIGFCRNGVVAPYSSGSVSIDALTTGTNIRYDIRYFDPLTLTFGIKKGTERTNDPTAFAPTLDSDQMGVLLLRVTGTTASFVQIWDVYDGEVRSIRDQAEAERRRSRQKIAKVRAKIRRGDPVHVVGFGDSITAFQKEPPSSSAPNGVHRDRATAALVGNTSHYLRDAYGDDVVDDPVRVPLYTAVQNGWADDGAGTTHTRIGWNWALAEAAIAAGYTLGSGGWLYDNFGIGGNASDDAISGGTPTAWLSNAVALNADLAIIGLGMNERGDTGTEERLILIAQEFKDAGTEVLFVGCPRPRVGSTEDWRFTNRAIRRAAEFTDSAFLSMTPLYEGSYIGSIGISSADVCAANKNNHPGLEELEAIGRELVKIVMLG